VCLGCPERIIIRMDIAVKIGLLRMVTVAAGAGIAIYVNNDMTSVAVASAFGFLAGYFTRIRDQLKGK